ncbi:hypothetical protein GCM10007385_44400 [Tateyamaria omphalii]|nr:hypothetical protein GCM10007385_44400 [Tateyamaria omphalii]
MKLTSDLFEPHVGADLIVHLDDGAPFPITLTKVTGAGNPVSEDEKSGGAAHTAFVLDLKGPVEPVLPSLTFPVSAENIPPTPVFISAHAQDEGGTYYSIVIS